MKFVLVENSVPLYPPAEAWKIACEWNAQNGWDHATAVLEGPHLARVVARTGGGTFLGNIEVQPGAA